MTLDLSSEWSSIHITVETGRGRQRLGSKPKAAGKHKFYLQIIVGLNKWKRRVKAATDCHLVKCRSCSGMSTPGWSGWKDIGESPAGLRLLNNCLTHGHQRKSIRANRCQILCKVRGMQTGFRPPQASPIDIYWSIALHNLVNWQTKSWFRHYCGLGAGNRCRRNTFIGRMLGGMTSTTHHSTSTIYTHLTSHRGKWAPILNQGHWMRFART